MIAPMDQFVWAVQIKGLMNITAVYVILLSVCVEPLTCPENIHHLLIMLRGF